MKKGLFILLFLYGAAVAFSAVSLFAAQSPAAAQRHVTISQTETPAEDKPPIEDIKRFTTAISHVKNYYVDPVKDQTLFENAIRGMVGNLDPHSAYLDAQEFKDLNDTTKGEFGGLGLEVTLEDEMLKVISPIDDTPAAKAGIKPGDRIIMLDNQLTKDMSLKDAVNKMRGEKGTKIRLTILREKNNKPIVVELVREIIQIKSVKSELIDKKYGYIKISHFQLNTPEDLGQAVRKLSTQAGGKLAGLILDLRNNPGGLLDAAVQVADDFIDVPEQEKNHLIVYTKGRIESAQYKAVAHPGDLMKNAPIVVLINEGSASGSEIVAGALQDYKRAILIGMKSFGKGSVQTVIPLDDNHAIKLTTALYYTPAGRSIQATGIQPDIEIKNIAIDNKQSDNDVPSIFSSIKEANLKRHLANGNQKAESVVSGGNTDKNTDYLYKDFQLHEALNLLKGLAMAKN